MCVGGDDADVVCQGEQKHRCVSTEIMIIIAVLAYKIIVIDHVCVPGVETVKFTEENCSHGDIRLINDGVPHLFEGRLEVCVNNVWGTVCEIGFDRLDAQVVCMMAGFSAGRSKLYNYSVDHFVHKILLRSHVQHNVWTWQRAYLPFSTGLRWN